jgi:hypothetical protein
MNQDEKGNTTHAQKMFKPRRLVSAKKRRKKMELYGFVNDEARDDGTHHHEDGRKISKSLGGIKFSFELGLSL